MDKYMTAKNLAFVVSRIFGPVPLLCLLWLTTALKSGIGFWKALWVYPLIFLVGIAVPFFITTAIIVAKGRTLDFDWKKREDRIILIPILIVFWALTLVLTRFLTNQTIYHLALLAGMVTAATFAITAVFKSKISMHAAASSGVFWGVNFLTHFRYWWLFLLLIPIVWARHRLKIHTGYELVAGILLANGLIILAVFIFGLPAAP